MKKDISKRIFFRFSNTFTKQDILTVAMPYLPFEAAKGYYSKLYKRIKYAAALECESRLVKGKKWFSSEKNNRTIITLPSGFGLDMPYDVTDKDISIIKHHLVGLKMAAAD